MKMDDDDRSEAIAQALIQQLRGRSILTEEEVNAVMESSKRRSESLYENKTPGWWKGGALQSSHASAVEHTSDEFDFTPWGLGILNLRIELIEEGKSGSSLRLDRSATEPNPHGWCIAFYRYQHTDEEPMCEVRLDQEQTGTKLLFPEDLGFDPSTTPFQYMLFPLIP